MRKLRKFAERKQLEEVFTFEDRIQRLRKSDLLFSIHDPVLRIVLPQIRYRKFEDLQQLLIIGLKGRKYVSPRRSLGCRSNQNKL